MKKFLVTVLILAVLGGSGYAVWRYLGPGKTESSDANNVVFVDSVSMIAGLEGGTGLNNRYNGVIEPQETWKVEQSQDQKIEEVYVKVGETVKTGQKLFKYDTTEAQNSLAQAEIDLERTANDIENTKAQIEELKVAQAKAGADEQLNYTIEIQTAENTVKRTEYEQKSKKVEMEQLKKTINNSVVSSEIDGVVKTINTDSSSMNAYTGEPDPLITILATGDYRVKGTVNEQNMHSLMLGSRVIVHSRVNEDQIWRGTLDSIDMESASSNQTDMYSSNQSNNGSSTYPFYVVLDDDEGLMLGQHVYIEMDNGQMEVKSGLWLPSYYIVQEEGSDPYVWAANSKDRLEKRVLTLGEFDEELDQYEILDGLAGGDYITYPSQGLQEGMPITHNIDEATFGMGGSEEDMNEEFDENLNFDDFLATGYDATMPDASMADGIMDDIKEGDLADEDGLSEEQFLGDGEIGSMDLGNGSLIGGFDSGL